MCNNWCDIETAPKDGQNLLILFDDDKWNVCFMSVGRWYDDEVGFCTGEFMTESFDRIALNATHWMPLPETPHKETEK